MQGRGYYRGGRGLEDRGGFQGMRGRGRGDYPMRGRGRGNYDFPFRGGAERGRGYGEFRGGYRVGYNEDNDTERDYKNAPRNQKYN